MGYSTRFNISWSSGLFLFHTRPAISFDLDFKAHGAGKSILLIPLKYIGLINLVKDL